MRIRHNRPARAAARYCDIRHTRPARDAVTITSP